MDNSGNYALLSFDGVCLLLPQANVVTIEMSSSFDRQAQGNESLGKLSLGNQEWPVYAIDAQFNSLGECPQHYRYCVAVGIDGAAVFSLACEQVGAIVVESEDDFEPLPDCMRTPMNPIESLLYREQKLMLKLNVERMANYLSPEVAA